MMFKKQVYFLTISLFVFSCSVHRAQNLQRKYFNGIYPLTLSDSTKRALDIENGLGVSNLVETGSAFKAGIQPGDVILELNGIKITMPADFKSLQLGELREGDKLDYKVLRNGKTIHLTTKAIARPKETKAGIEYIYGSVPYKEGKLSSIFSFAKVNENGKMPGVLFIQGYTCTDNLNLQEQHPYRRLTDGLSENGFLVLRVDKPGQGDSKNTPKCEDIDINEEILGFENALLELKRNPRVDTNNIFIWGHSMGGVIAPVLAAKYPWVKGVSVYGTTAHVWGEYIVNMTRIQSEGFGIPPVEVDKIVRETRQIVNEIFINKKSAAQVAQENPSLIETLKSQFSWNEGSERLFTRSVAFNQTLDDLKVSDFWSETTSKVLAFYGEADIEALNPEGAKNIVNTVNFYHKGNGTYYFLPETDHSFAKVGSIQDGYASKASEDYYQIMLQNFNPEVISVSVSWMKNVINPSKNQFSIVANEVLKEKVWRPLKTEPYPGKQDDITFINENLGWYVNGGGNIFKTTDGGANWIKQLSKEGTFFRCIGFIDSLNGFAGTVGTDYFPNVKDTIPLYRTIDGGKTWEPVSYSGPYVKGLCAIDIVKEQFINHGKTDYKYHIYAVGRVGSPANMMVSHDGGQSFSSWEMNTNCQMLFDIKMFNTKEGFVCAASSDDLEKSNALILYTADAGKTWEKRYQSSRPFETTWKMSFPSKNVGYATIQSYNTDPTVNQQRIAKTIDGGKTWTELDLCIDASAREFGIGFIDELHGFVGTMNSGYETTDGGLTWSKIDLGRACNKIRIYKNEAGGAYGYAIGVNLFKM